MKHRKTEHKIRKKVPNWKHEKWHTKQAEQLLKLIKHKKHFEGLMLFVNDKPDGLMKEKTIAEKVLKLAREQYPTFQYKIKKVHIGVVK